MIFQKDKQSRFVAVSVPAMVILAGVVCACSSGVSFAQNTGLDAYDAYVAGLENLGLEVDNGSIDYDASTDTLTILDSTLSFKGTLKDVSIGDSPKSDEGGIADPDATVTTDLTYSFSFFADTVTIQGLLQEDTHFSSKSWVVSENSKLEIAGRADGQGRFSAESRMSEMTLENYVFTMPVLPTPDPGRQASRWLPFLKTTLLSSYDAFMVDGTAMTYEAYSEESGIDRLLASGTIQMDGYRIANVTNGKIETYSLDKMTQTLLARDERSGQMLSQTSTQGKTEYENVDVAAVLDLFDPMVPASEDKQTFIGYGSSLDYETTQDVGAGQAVVFKIDRSTIRDVHITKRNGNLLGLLDQLLAETPPAPEAIVGELFQLYRSFGIADARVSGIAIDFPLPDSDETATVGIKEMAMMDVDSNGIGELMVVGVDAPDLPGGASFKLDWAALGDIEFADYPPIESMIATLISDPEFGEQNPLAVARAFVPRSLSYEIEGLDIALPETGRTQIGKSEFSISTAVPPIPTSLYAKNDGIRIPAGSIDEPEAQKLLNALGLSEINWSDETRLYWDETTLDLRLERLQVEIEGVGSAEASARFANIPRAVFADPEGQGQLALVTGQFVEALVRIKDGGATSKGLAHVAGEQNLPVSVLQQALVEQAADAAGFLNNPEFTGMVRKAVSDFLNEPGTLTVSLAPQNPVPVAQILGSMAAPQTLPGLLNIQVTAD